MLHAVMTLNLWNSKLPSQWDTFIIRVAVLLVSLHSNRHPNEENILSLVPDTQFSLLQLSLLQISYSVHCYKANYSLFFFITPYFSKLLHLYLLIYMQVSWHTHDTAQSQGQRTTGMNHFSLLPCGSWYSSFAIKLDIKFICLLDHFFVSEIAFSQNSSEIDKKHAII